MQKYVYNVSQLFTKEYWVDKFENTGAELLVGGPLLSWSYLEIGLVEAVGALTAFFVVMYRRGISPRDAHIMQKGAGPPTNYWTENAEPYNGIDGPTQVDILAEAQSMYYWSIMRMQMWNLFACKARLTLPFGKYMFANRATFYCILAGASLAAFIIYSPGVEVVFKTSRNLIPLLLVDPHGIWSLHCCLCCATYDREADDEAREMESRNSGAPDVSYYSYFPKHVDEN